MDQQMNTELFFKQKKKEENKKKKKKTSAMKNVKVRKPILVFT